MLNIGITGGIGSGKTTVCKIFEAIGIPIYYADERAKALMVEDEKLIEGIQEVFGKVAYFENGELNRKHIAKIAFSDKEKLSKLNALVHPAVRLDGEKWFNSQIEKPYALKEAALHFESGGYQLMDKMITVYAPKLMRIERVMQRDEVTKAEVEARIDKQMSDEKKMELSDFIIYNDNSQRLIEQVLNVHHALIKIDFNGTVA
jgi:dephospho-CoA kinase